MAPKLQERFPASARIHLPVHWTYGITIDERMPSGSRWPEQNGRGRADPSGRQLTYPFLVVENADGNGGCVEIAVRTPHRLQGPDSLGISNPGAVRYGRPKVLVERTRIGFTVTFTSGTEDPPAIRQVDSWGSAAKHHRSWIGKTHGLKTIEERIGGGELPSWASRIPLVVVFDMWLANYEVAHNYVHLRDFCRDLRRLGVPAGAVLYIPGWCGPYDGGYPGYEPVPELGGRSAFGEAVEAAHEAGYAVMLHTLGWGADPYRSGFETLLPVAQRNYGDPADPPPPIVHRAQGRKPPGGSFPTSPEDPLRGPYTGWPGGGEWRSLDWTGEKQPVGAVRRSANGWLFETKEIPERCEAVVAVGGLGKVGGGTVKLTINGRSLTSPAGWFAVHGSYTFPFTYLLTAGVNPVEIAVYGAEGNASGRGEGSTPVPESAWIRIDEAYSHDPVRNVWTQPAVGADLDDPVWHEAFCGGLSQTVREFGVDLVHIDATTLWRWDEGGMFARLKRRVPPATAFGTEVATAPGLRFFLLHQTNPSGLYRAAGFGAEEDGAWRPEPTDLSWLVTEPYGRFYAHLCDPQAFVPHRCVCRVDPIGRSRGEEETQRIRRSLLLQGRHHMIPALRVNYRDYGLDDLTRRFLSEHIVEDTAG